MSAYYDYTRPDPAMAAYQQRMIDMQRAGYTPPPPFQPPMPRYEGSQPMPKMRIVTSIEEARAAQIDLDGTPTFFRSPAEGKIYEKSIGLDGLPVFNIYQRVETPPPKPQTVTAYADAKEVQSLQERVNQLEQWMKGVSSNVQSNANDAVNGATAKQ